MTKNALPVAGFIMQMNEAVVVGCSLGIHSCNRGLFSSVKLANHQSSFNAILPKIRNEASPMIWMHVAIT